MSLILVQKILSNAAAAANWAKNRSSMVVSFSRDDIIMSWNIIWRVFALVQLTSLHYTTPESYSCKLVITVKRVVDVVYAKPHHNMPKICAKELESCFFNANFSVICNDRETDQFFSWYMQNHKTIFVKNSWDSDLFIRLRDVEVQNLSKQYFSIYYMSLVIMLS